MIENIYVPLKNEGVPARRLTPAYRLDAGKYIVLKPPDYNLATETWIFPPGTIIECQPGPDEKPPMALHAISDFNPGSQKPRPTTPKVPSKLRVKINLVTLLLAGSYLVLTVVILNTLRSNAAANPNVLTALFTPFAAIFGPIALWLMFFVQLALINTFAQRMSFGKNLLLSLLVGPVAAFLILRALFFLWSLLS